MRNGLKGRMEGAGNRNRNLASVGREILGMGLVRPFARPKTTEPTLLNAVTIG